MKQWLKAFVLFLMMGPLVGCLPDLESLTMEKAEIPLPDATRSELAEAGLRMGAPIYVRIFKLEAEMELWMQGEDGRFKLFRTYNICNWSGDIGPKVVEGDRQSPEGYYLVSSRQLNPASKYYLSFNIGFPNAYDRAHGRTGSALMVHGGCLSQGCYAITDENVQELYSFARDAFNAGQPHFALHAYPFRMTQENMMLHKDSEWRGFWVNLKQGYDIFEKSKIPPVAGVSNGRYVFFPGDRQVPQAYMDGGEKKLIASW